MRFSDGCITDMWRWFSARLAPYTFFFLPPLVLVTDATRVSDTRWARAAKSDLLANGLLLLLHAQPQLVRVDQEEQLPGIQPQPDPPLCLLADPVPQAPTQREHHPLRPQTGTLLYISRHALLDIGDIWLMQAERMIRVSNDQFACWIISIIGALLMCCRWDSSRLSLAVS